MLIDTYIRCSRVILAEINPNDKKVFNELFSTLKGYLKKPCDVELYICNSLNMESNLTTEKSTGKKYLILDISQLFIYQYFALGILQNNWEQLEKAFYTIRQYSSYKADESFLTVLYSGILDGGNQTFSDDKILYHEPVLSDQELANYMNLMVYFLIYHEFSHYFGNIAFVNPKIRPLVKRAIDCLIDGEKRLFGSYGMEKLIEFEGDIIYKEALCDCNALAFMIELLYDDFSIQHIYEAALMVISFSHAIDLCKNHLNQMDQQKTFYELRGSILGVFLNLFGQALNGEEKMAIEIENIHFQNHRVLNFLSIINDLLDLDERTMDALFDNNNNLYYAYKEMQRLQVDINYNMPETIFWND